jgi:ATPase subunit of ABC transporter with duplicated ATPase domains
LARAQIAGKQLVKDFTFDFLPGDRLGIAGRNGTGKSTLLDLIAGLREPQVGGCWQLLPQLRLLASTRAQPCPTAACLPP